MIDSFVEPANPANFVQESDRKIIEAKVHKISLNKDEYELIMEIDDKNYIQFKLTQINTIAFSYYESEFYLPTIMKLLTLINENMKEVFNFYEKVLSKNKVKLVYNIGKSSVFLNFVNIVNFDELVETNLEIKEVKLTNEEILKLLCNEAKSLKTQGTKKE